MMFSRMVVFLPFCNGQLQNIKFIYVLATISFAPNSVIIVRALHKNVQTQIRYTAYQIRNAAMKIASNAEVRFGTWKYRTRRNSA
jgi:hypothetical protein